MHRCQPGNVGFLEASSIEIHASLRTWQHRVSGSIFDRDSCLVAILVTSGFCKSNVRDSCITANLATSDFWKHLCSRPMHRCQPGNIGFLEASSIEIHASLPTCQHRVSRSIFDRNSCLVANLVTSGFKKHPRRRLRVGHFS